VIRYNDLRMGRLEDGIGLRAGDKAPMENVDVYGNYFEMHPRDDTMELEGGANTAASPAMVMVCAISLGDANVRGRDLMKRRRSMERVGQKFLASRRNSSAAGSSASQGIASLEKGARQLPRHNLPMNRRGTQPRRTEFIPFTGGERNESRFTGCLLN